MGSSLNTPGFVKFWWKNDLLQTPYKTIHEIPLININKLEVTIPAHDSNIAILHYNDSKKSAQFLSQINLPNTQVYAIPNQNSSESFSTIKQSNPKSLGKMIMNGPSSHPLFKFLKKNCDQFYSYSTCSSKKQISSPTGLFIYKFNKKLNQPIVTYYNEKQIETFVIKGVQKSV